MANKLWLTIIELTFIYFRWRSTVIIKSVFLSSILKFKRVKNTTTNSIETIGWSSDWTCQKQNIKNDHHYCISIYLVLDSICFHGDLVPNWATNCQSNWQTCTRDTVYVCRFKFVCQSIGLWQLYYELQTIFRFVL